MVNDMPIDLEPYVSQLVASVNALNIPHHTSATAEFITISVGATTAHIDHYDELSAMIQAADRALYRVKETGRNHYRIEPKHDTSPV